MRNSIRSTDNKNEAWKDGVIGLDKMKIIFASMQYLREADDFLQQRQDLAATARPLYGALKHGITQRVEQEVVNYCSSLEEQG